MCVSHSVVSSLCDPMDYSLPGSSLHGILQERILEWVSIPFSRGSSPPRDQIHVSCISGRFFIIWATSKAPQKGVQNSNADHTTVMWSQASVLAHTKWQYRTRRPSVLSPFHDPIQLSFCLFLDLCTVQKYNHICSWRTGQMIIMRGPLI